MTFQKREERSMDLIHHTIAWCKGEIIEGTVALICGLIVLCAALLLWKFSSTPFTKMMPIPLLLVSLFCIGLGATLIVSNNQRISDYKQAYQEDVRNFVLSEKERTDKFIAWYPYTMYMVAGMFFAAMICYITWGSPLGRAIGLCLAMLGVTFMLVDSFSEERALIYRAKIESTLVDEVEN